MTYIGWHHAPEGGVKVSGHSSGRLLPTVKLFGRRRAREGRSLPGIPLLPLAIGGCIFPRVVSFHRRRRGPEGRATLLRRPVLHVRARAGVQIPSSALSPTSNIWRYNECEISYLLELRVETNTHVQKIIIEKQWMLDVTAVGFFYFEAWDWDLVHRVPPLDCHISPPRQLPASWGTPGEIGCSHAKLLYIISTWLWLHKYQSGLTEKQWRI